MAFFFDSPRLQVQYAARVLRLLSAQLFPYFFHIVRMNLIVQTRRVPFSLKIYLKLKTFIN